MTFKEPEYTVIISGVTDDGIKANVWYRTQGFWSLRKLDEALLPSHMPTLKVVEKNQHWTLVDIHHPPNKKKQLL